MRTPVRWSIVVGITLLFWSAWLPAANAQEADMAVTKTADADQAAAGSDITYTITVSNNGPDAAASATLNDPLPAGTTFVSLSSPGGWVCSTPSVGSGGTVNCTNATFPVSSGDVFTLVVHIPSNTAPGTTFTNKATVSTSTFDPNDENNTASASTTVPGISADIRVTKVASANQVFANSDVTYTIQISNSGPDTAASAELFDGLPLDMTFVSLSQSSSPGPVWSCSTPSVGTNGNVVCTTPTLAEGDLTTFTLVGHIPSGASVGTTYNNSAVGSSGTSDSDSGNNTAVAATVVSNCLSSLTVTSNADSGPGSLRQAIVDVCAGGTITFDMNQVVSPITLTTAELLINKNLTITGPGANVLTVAGNDTFRLVNITLPANGTATIQGLSFTKGRADTSVGTNGTLEFNNAGTLNLVNCEFFNNSAAQFFGGVLYTNAASKFNVSGCTFRNNTARAVHVGSTPTDIINSTISNNTERPIVIDGGAAMTLTNCTIADNTPAGVTLTPAGGVVTLRNTILSQNNGANLARSDTDCSATGTQKFISAGHNLIDDASSSNLCNGPQSGDLLGSTFNPLLRTLANNGGTTSTRLPSPGSPVIDVGDNCVADNSCTPALADPLATDQRGVGFPRSIGSAVDIGAVEVDYLLVPTAGTPQSTAVNTAFPTALQATLTESDIPVSGISVTFTAPTSGARGTFSSGNTATVVTDANGVAAAPTFTANSTPGTYNVAATTIGIADAANFSLTNVAGPTTHFGVTAPANATAGVAFNFTVSALDASNNVVTNYAGTVKFTSSDPNATLPANSTLTNGTGAFSATLKTSGTRTITATDTSTAATGTSNSIVVAAAAATHFSVSAPANVTGSTAFNFTVTALDQFENRSTGYTGTVRFNSSDLNATLPANSTLTNGQSTFSATLRTVGNQTITATDTVNSAINGTSNIIAVSKTTPGLTGTVSPTSGNVGTAFTDTAVLSAATTPTGTMTFTVYGPNAANCATAIFTSSKTVNGNGNYVSDPFTPTAPGTYTFVALYSGDVNNNPVSTVCGAASQTFTANSTAPTPTPAQSLNISTRVRTELGDRAMIGGFIISGNAPKSVVLRGLGPSLSSFGLTDLLANPQLELKGPNNNLIFLNKDWKDSQRSIIEGTNFQPKDDRESVIVISLNPGAYTAILSGEGGTTGIGLVEVYDTSPNSDSKLGNISTRGFVQTGDKVMIGGFSLGGNNNPTRIAIRGRGPSLSQFGLSPVLADPTLELRNQNGTILVVNDDWQSDTVSAANLTANGLGLSDPKEAGIFTSLPAGQFTAVLAGKSGGIGIGLIEIYNLQ